MSTSAPPAWESEMDVRCAARPARSYFSHRTPILPGGSGVWRQLTDLPSGSSFALLSQTMSPSHLPRQQDSACLDDKRGGSNLRKFSAGKNSHGASFSPGGESIAFIAYTDVANRNQASYEIHIMRVHGTGPRQLIDNNCCAYQLR